MSLQFVLLLPLAAVACALTAVPLHAQVGPPTPPLVPSLPPAPAPTPTPVSGMVGVPTIDLGGGFTIKPRGRLQLDYGDLSGPANSAVRTAGREVSLRRLRFGVDGALPGGVTYRFDADFTGNVIEVVDAYAAWRTGPVTVTVGQHNVAQSLEELTSDTDISFTERAAFTGAFGFARRLGVSVEYVDGPLVLQAGVTGENLLTVNDGVENARALNGRAVYAPRIGTAQLHFGGHVAWRSFGEDGRSVRYRQRGYVRSVDTRFVATPAILADGETGWGLEFAAQSGRWHVQAEAQWQTLHRLGGTDADPAFFGAAVEAGMFLTPDQRTYRSGIFRGVSPRRPVTTGGIGAVQIAVRYDRLDLSDGPVIGGEQDGYQAAVSWWPVAQVRLLMTYARLDYRNAAVTLSGARDYRLDAVNARFQLVF